jgi:hypothetical protein
MMGGIENKCLLKLRELEYLHGVVEKFHAFDSSSWVLLKNIIFERSLSRLAFTRVNRNSLFSLKTLCLIAMSLWNYALRVLRFTSQDIFVGAGTGVFPYRGKLLDSYLPSELASEPGLPAIDTLYLLSANRVSTMWEQRAYLLRHNVIVFSFLVAPLRFFLGRILASLLWLNRRVTRVAYEVSAQMANVSVEISPKEILRLHGRFCAGYLIYRVMLFPFKIRRAYVVSAYSNSELCAVLRKMGAEIIEVQHGLIGPTHRGYNYSTRSNRLPVPHKVSVYNKLWRDELLTAGFFETEQIVIGGRLKYKLAEAEESPFDFPYVVVTGQGILIERISEFIAEYAELDSRLHLVYVPHPTEGPDYIGRIKAAAGNSHRIHVIDRPTATTERLIIDSAAHLSVYSSCHFDAIHYKGKTFVLDILDENAMHYYIKRHPEMFVTVRSSKELLRHLGEVF